MVKKSLGFVELEWICPNCGARNPGPRATCTGCGAAQPADVEFVQAAREEILADEEKIARARVGPDIHCAYCGARNPATAKRCRQCGADLSEGTARAGGRVVGAHRDAPAPPVTCPACGAQNPATGRRCTQCGASLTQTKPRPARPGRGRTATGPPRGIGRVSLFLLSGFILLVAIFIVLSQRTRDTVAQVAAINWKRTVSIEALLPVTREDWRDEIPAGAALGQCRPKVHHTQDEPALGAREVCGTPYTVDKGSGYGEVVQDCEYQVYADWCEYQGEAWQRVEPAIAEGHDLNPRWPAISLGTQEREAGRDEEYVVVFDSDGKTYRYRVRDVEEFGRYALGSRWKLQVNTFNAVTDVEPVR